MLRPERRCLECPDQYFSPNGLTCIPLPDGMIVSENRLKCAAGFTRSMQKCISSTHSEEITKFSLENAQRVKYSVFNEAFNLENSLLVDSDFIKGNLGFGGVSEWKFFFKYHIMRIFLIYLEEIYFFYFKNKKINLKNKNFLYLDFSYIKSNILFPNCKLKKYFITGLRFAKQPRPKMHYLVAKA